MNEKLLKQVDTSQINHPKEARPHRDNVRSLHTNHWANRSFNEYDNAA